MATTSNYFDAAYPEPWQVLGVNLKPFSLGHYVKLYRLGCAFVADEVKPATLGDLLLGVAVCSMDSHPDPAKDQFWQWLNKPEPEGWRKWAGRLFKRLGLTVPSPFEIEMALFGKKVGNVKISDKIELFKKYVDAHSRSPAYWDMKPNEGGAGGHWAQSLAHVLTRDCGYTQEDVYNVPLSRALADFFKHAEGEGVVRLMTQEERKALGL